MKRWGLVGLAGVLLAAGALGTALADQPTGQYLGIANNAFYGWACAQGQQSATSVELYLDADPDHGGRPAAQVLANLPSGSHCGSTNVGWRFDIAAVSDLVDGSHRLFFVALGSGGVKVTLQSLGPPPLYDFKAAIRGAVTGLAGPTLSGWACEVDNSTNNQVGLYLDVGPDQGGQPVATTTANLPLGSANCSTGPGDPHSNNNTNIAYQFNLGNLPQTAGVHQLFVAAASSKSHRIPLAGTSSYDFSAATRSSYPNRIDVSGGVAHLVIDNVATPGLGVGPICGRNRGAGELHDWSAAGFTLTRMIFPLGDDVYQNCGNVWTPSWDGGHNYYWNDLDYEISRRLNDDRVRIILAIALDGAGSQVPDYLSDSWVSSSKAAIQAMVTHLNTTFPGKVVGYELFNGETYDCNFPVDVSSSAATTRFRAFLTAKYQTDQALQKAWNQGGVTLATAQLQIVPSCPRVGNCKFEYTLPADQDRTAMDRLMPLFSSASMQQYADSREFAFREKEQVIYNFADDIKQASQGQALVGARSGEFPEMPWFPEMGFKFYTMDFYSYPSIDFYEIWETYQLPREFGPLGGSGVQDNPPTGLASLNKLFMVQNDFRIAYGGTSQRPSYHLTLPPPWWDVVPQWGYDPITAASVQKLRRVFTNSVVNGTPFYLFQMTDYYDQPYLLPPDPIPSEWKVQVDIASRALRADRSSVAEVAYVMDPSFQKNYADHWDDYIGGSGNEGEQPVYQPGPGDYTEIQPIARWARAGVPFDIIFLSQIENTSYKVYVFYHTISLSADQVQRIQKVLSANHAVGIFVDADGMVDGNGSAGPPTLGLPFNSNPDVGAYVSNLTGMHITGVMEGHTSKLAPTSFFLGNGGVQKYPDSWVNHTGYLWPPDEVDFNLYPSFYVTPTEGVNPLATFNEDTPGRVAAAERPTPPGTNIKDILYSATSMVPPDLMRYAVLKAGAHQYSDTEDHIFVDKSFVGFHTEAAGTITLTLPQASALHDVFIANTWPGNICQPQTDYPSNATQRIAVQANCTYLFYRGTGADWAALRGH